MFTEYQSRPIIRRAYQIKEGDQVLYSETTSKGILLTDATSIGFAAYQEPVVGDFIVYLNEDDVYHCAEDVFRERNVVD